MRYFASTVVDTEKWEGNYNSRVKGGNTCRPGTEIYNRQFLEG